MTLRALVPLVLAVVAPVVLAYVAGRFSRWHAGRRDPIDALIAKNAATPRAGMKQVDWQKTEKAGETRWQETLRAQRKTRRPLLRPADKLIAFGTRRSR